MKINKLIIILGLFSGLCSSSQAQSNGSFLGRRVLFNFTTNFSPAWGNPNFFNHSEHWQKYYAFNFDISPGMEIIAWKKGTVGALYHWFETRFDYPEDSSDPFWGALESSVVVAPLNVHGFGVYYKQYIGRKARAPIGTYWRFQLDGFFYSSQIPSQITGSLFAFKAEFGHDFLFFDRLHVSTGFSFGFPFCRWRNLNYGNSNFSLLNLFSVGAVAMEDYVNARLLGHYYIGFVLSVGILAF